MKTQKEQVLKSVSNQFHLWADSPQITKAQTQYNKAIAQEQISKSPQHTEYMCVKIGGHIHISMCVWNCIWLQLFLKQVQSKNLFG